MGRVWMVVVPPAEQDRSLWDHDAVTEGVELLTRSLARAPVGPYQIQAAIAAVHAEAARAEDTYWAQILALYNLLTQSVTNPVVALNRAVAVAMVHGPRAGLGLLDDLTSISVQLVGTTSCVGQHAGPPARAPLTCRDAAPVAPPVGRPCGG